MIHEMRVLMRPPLPPPPSQECLQQVLAEQSLKLVDVSGDGNCLFHAISLGASVHGVDVDHVALRARVASTMAYYLDVESLKLELAYGAFHFLCAGDRMHDHTVIGMSAQTGGHVRQRDPERARPCASAR